MQIVIDIPEEIYKWVNDVNKFYIEYGLSDFIDLVKNGTPLPKGHGFIAICDSDFPITEEIKQELKNTVFVGDDDCRYCFDMTAIIEADKAESEDKE